MGPFPPNPLSHRRLAHLPGQLQYANELESGPKEERNAGQIRKSLLQAGKMRKRFTVRAKYESG